jgi:hypothetical protein
MHKKSEVDLRVAQELKNNRDFIYQTNQYLQSLSQGIVSLSLQHESVIAKSESDKKSTLIEFEKICDKVDRKLHQIDQRMGDLESKNIKDIDNLKYIINEMMKSFVVREQFSEQITDVNYRVKKISDNVTQFIDSTIISNAQIYAHIKSEIKKVKVDLTPIVPEVDPVKKAIDERFDVFKVDFEGLAREIAILKKAIAYDEKRFENIYTLIQRLKAEKP